jgi:hypothetical protein
MNNFTNSIRMILNRSNTGEKFTHMKKTLTILITIGLMTAIALAQSESEQNPDRHLAAHDKPG